MMDPKICSERRSLILCPIFLICSQMNPSVVIEAFLKFTSELLQFSANTSTIFSHYPLGRSIEAIAAMTEAPAFITSALGLIKTLITFYLI